MFITKLTVVICFYYIGISSLKTKDTEEMVSSEQSTSNHRLLSKNADSFDHSSSLKSPRRMIGHEHNPRLECLPELLEELDGTVNKSKPNIVVSLNKYPRKRLPQWRTLASVTDVSGDGRSNECREKVAAFRRIENVNVYNDHEDFNTYRSREGNYLPQFKGIFEVIKSKILRNGVRNVPPPKKKNGTKNKRVDCRGCMRKVSEVTEIAAATDANDELDSQRDLEEDMLDTLKTKRRIERITASEDVAEFLTLVDDIQAEEFNGDAKAKWAYEVNMTKENKMRTLMTSLQLAKIRKTIWNIAKKFNLEDMRDPSILRRMQMLQNIGNAALPDDKFAQHEENIKEMQSIYSTANICHFKNESKCDLWLEPDLTKILENSRDPEELKHVWLKWRDATGRRMKDMFVQYVELENEVARLNNFSSVVDYWLQSYEEPNFRSHLEDLWAKIRPLYVQLHAYVRRKLREVYGEIHVPRSGPIPAHLFGNMWAHTWSSLYNISKPFPSRDTYDYTRALLAKGYTPKRMFKEADDFFKSINLTEVPRSFWKKSVFEKSNRSEEMVCHPNAWDMFDRKDFRIKMCASVNMDTFFTSHHEMGHIQYYLQYKDQPFVFRNGANPGFHEAVGDVVALSVMSRDHLRHLGLLRGAVHPSPEVEINFLYEMALQKIAFLPFGYLVDAWRWDVFAGKVGPEAYNRHWWDMRFKYQGITPPETRTEQDFDPGCKFHVAASVPYIRYFVSYIIQFQFHRALCKETDIFDLDKRRSKPLHQCDIYNHTRAGNLLKRMLQMGSSRPWPDAMEVLTGQMEMDASGLLDYFKPLSDWLKRENIRTNEPLDWLTD